MNSTNFNQTGGFPLKTERLQELQTAFNIFQSYGALAGNLTIISGCELLGSTIKNGVVYINGEPLEFREATVTETSTVIIIDEPVNRAFENGVVKQVHTIRYATFGTAETSWPWASFKRIDPVVQLMIRLDSLEKKAAVFQTGGGMVLWNKPAVDIPTGWQEVVNWRGRMPIGLDENQVEFNEIGKPGGAKNKTLSIEEMPSHTHGFRAYVQSGSNSGSGGEAAGYFEDRQTKGTGGGQQFSLLNPYRVVLFIEFIG
ncbi:phage baseplate protein [Flavobacterium sp. XS1P27]|uniref:phage baseplate protein n=1 Tax=Flavobacterium sp. XS1P27 TaxID=3401724 RepID=UPI003AB01468